MLRVGWVGLPGSEGEHSADQGLPGDGADDAVDGDRRDVLVEGLLEAADGGVGLGPEDPVDLQALVWVAGQVAELELLLDPRTGSPWLPCLTVMISADQVRGPAMPSTARPFCCWKARTAASVMGPKMPSTARLWPRARSRYCRVLTGCSWSPLRTSGHGLIVDVVAVIGSSSLDVDSAPLPAAAAEGSS